MKKKYLELTKRIQAIAQIGLAYATNDYDLERYRELREISVELMHEFSGADISKIKTLFASQSGYPTPMVDIRAVIFKDNKILLVKEKKEGCWALPGGWADIGYTPSEVAIKEVKEEAGLDVQASRILAILDKKCHNHPPQPFYTYKIFIQCDITGGKLNPGHETSDVQFFSLDNLPELSKDRNTKSQIKMVFKQMHDPTAAVEFD
ncbi:MAG: NUDIX hydrolase [Promethearchaeota archaeon]